MLSNVAFYLTDSLMRSVVLIFSIFVPLAGLADLSFETRELSYEASVEDTEYEAHFPFKNSGDEEVIINRVKTSCGCTAAGLDKRKYAPGEEGVIKATFEFGNRKGAQHKSVHVYTEDGQRHRLEMKVNIPSRWELDNRVLVWRKEQGLDSKTVTARFPLNSPVEITEVEYDEDAFSVEYQPDEQGEEVRFEVTPKEAGKLKTHAINVSAKDANGDAFTFRIYLRVY